MKKIGIIISLFTLFVVSCQKDTTQMKSDTNEKIKEIENALGVELKEATEADLDNSFYIPYEELKKIIDSDAPLISSGAGDLTNHDIKRFAEFTLAEHTIKTKVYNIDIVCKQKLFTFDFEITLEKYNNKPFWSMETQLDVASIVAKYKSASIKAIVTLKDSHMEFNWDFHANFEAKLFFNTVVDGRTFLFAVRFKTNTKVKLEHDPTGISYPLDGEVSFSFNF